MSVSTIGSVGGAAQPTRSSSDGTQAAALDSATFMKLLISQVQNQNPMKPMDSSALVEQLASFSQVQLGAEMNARLTTMLEVMSIGQASAVVGRGLIAADGSDLGIVDAVRYSRQGLVARVADGSEVLLDHGVTVRA